MGLKSLLLLLCFGLLHHLTQAINLGIAKGKHVCAPLMGACSSPQAVSERQRGRPCGHTLAAESYTRWRADPGTDPTPEHYRHWSAAHHFTQNEATLKDALPGMARQAYEEMVADARSQGIKPADVPSVMAALLVGTDIYFSSSLKGGNFLLQPYKGKKYVHDAVAEEVKLAIVRCQQAYNGQHNYGLACAEPLALQQFLSNNPTATITGKGKISSYGKLDRDGAEIGIIDPCAILRGEWGCSIFMKELDIEIVGNQKPQPQVPDLPTINPANALPHCFWDPPNS